MVVFDVAEIKLMMVMLGWEHLSYIIYHKNHNYSVCKLLLVNILKTIYIF